MAEIINIEDFLDDDDQFDLDALVEKAVEVLTGDGKPGLNQLTDVFGQLAEAEAGDIARDQIIDAYVARWHGSESTSDQKQRAGSLRSAWREEVRAYRDSLHDADVVPIREVDEESSEEDRALEYQALAPLVKDMAVRPNLLAEAVKAVQANGVAGEEEAIMLGVLSGVSCYTNDPISPLYTGASAGGKSTVVRKTLDLFPEEDVFVFTTLSPKALVYNERSFMHKIMFMMEATPLQRDDDGTLTLMFRALLSEKRLVHNVTAEDPDSDTGFTTREVDKPGVVSLFVTTTATGLDAELATRMIAHGVVDTEDQTRAVMQLLGRRAAGRSGPAPDIESWRRYLEWISYGPREVLVPYGDVLADLFPAPAVASRRYFPLLLNLIKAHALLHQAQRDREAGMVVATLDDYDTVRGFVAAHITQAIGGGLTPTQNRIMQVVAKELARDKSASSGDNKRRPHRAANNRREFQTSQAAIGRSLGIDPKTAGNNVRYLLENGYLENKERTRGKPYRLVMGWEGVEYDGKVGLGLVLPPVSDLEQR